MERVTASIGFGPDRMPDHHLTRTQEVVALVDVPLVPDHHVCAANGSDRRARSVTGMTWSEPDHHHRTLGTRPPRDRQRDSCSLAFRDNELGALARGGERGRFRDARRAHFGRDDLARVGHVDLGQGRRVECPDREAECGHDGVGRPQVDGRDRADRCEREPGLDERLVQQRLGCTRGCVRRRADPDHQRRWMEDGEVRCRSDGLVCDEHAGGAVGGCERNGPLERAVDDWGPSVEPRTSDTGDVAGGHEAGKVVQGGHADRVGGGGDDGLGTEHRRDTTRRGRWRRRRGLRTGRRRSAQLRRRTPPRDRVLCQ